MKKLYIIGIGPGEQESMTMEAVRAMEEAEILCGYTLYLDLVRDLFPGKEFRATPMTREMERCRMAVELASDGRTTAMLCSGDAGVYGMAAPVLTMAEKADIEVEIVPGVTAALSGAAVLGAPVNHDFAVISLSDLMTPWPVIERRLEAAAYGDFVVCLYNPMSKHRREHLSRACQILLRHKAADTVCGWVRNIGREGEKYAVLPLCELAEAELDMFTTVFIGNAATRVIDGRMVTPRGYEEKYGCGS